MCTGIITVTLQCSTTRTTPGTRCRGGCTTRCIRAFPNSSRSCYYLAVATCKPEYQAKPVCDHFHITELVDGIYGASTDNSRVDKASVIRYAFDNIGFNRELDDRALMVGDRWTDVDGAKACALDCLGCGWGYAEPNELVEHGAYRVIDHVVRSRGGILRGQGHCIRIHSNPRLADNVRYVRLAIYGICASGCRSFPR